MSAETEKIISIYIAKRNKEIIKFPSGFWVGDTGKRNAKICVKYLIEEILNLSDKDIKNKLSYDFFKENELIVIFKYVYNGNIYKLMTDIFPDKFKEWDFNIKKEEWTFEKGKEATKWLIEEKLKLHKKHITQQLNRKLFKECNLTKMLKSVFNNSLYLAVNSIYPNEFKEWEFKVHKSYWNEETGKRATRWLIEEKLKLSDLKIKKKITKDTFVKYNLYNMLMIVYKGSVFKAIDSIYPNEFKPWDFNVCMNYWNEENGIIATKWLVEEHFKIDVTGENHLVAKEIREKINQDSFSQNGLKAMLYIVFESSTYTAINKAYPNKFKPWQIRTTKNYWCEKTGIEATKWLIEDVLKFELEEVPQKLKYKNFIEYRLNSMLSTVFNNDIFLAVSKTYPNTFKKENFTRRKKA